MQQRVWGEVHLMLLLACVSLLLHSCFAFLDNQPSTLMIACVP
jgi:hypothetical protein